jgi:hypothetical protein
MDFVQHSIGDISVRFFGYLIFILAYSTVIHGAVRATFGVFEITNLKETWWDEAAIAVLGIFLALACNWNALFYIGGITEPQFVGALAGMAKNGAPGGYIPPWLTIGICNIVTGALAVGGRKTIVGVAAEFQAGLTAIKKIMSSKANGGSQ